MTLFLLTSLFSNVNESFLVKLEETQCVPTLQQQKPAETFEYKDGCAKLLHPFSEKIHVMHEAHVLM